MVKSAPSTLSTLFALSDDVDSLCLVRECRELEEELGSGSTHFTEEILGKSELSFRNVKDAIHKSDQKQLTVRCSAKSPVIAEIASQIGWSRLCDAALDLGGKSTKVLQFLNRAMSHHGKGNHPYPVCTTSQLQTSVLEHLLECHSSDLHLQQTINCEKLVYVLLNLPMSNFWVVRNSTQIGWFHRLSVFRQIPIVCVTSWICAACAPGWSYSYVYFAIFKFVCPSVQPTAHVQYCRSSFNCVPAFSCALYFQLLRPHKVAHACI